MSESKYVLYVITLGMLCAFAPMCTDMYLPALPSVMVDFNTSTSLVQISLASSFLGLATGQILIGPISDVYGRLKPLFISLLLFIISSFLCSIAEDIYSFIACRVFQGMSASGGIVLTRSIACDRFKGNELTSFMAFLMSINSIAPILAPIIGSTIITFASWRVIFIVLTVWGVLLILSSKCFVKESLAKEHRASSIIQSLSKMKDDIFNLKFMLSSLSLSFVMGGFFSYLAASPFVFEKIYGFTPFEYSLSFGFISILMSCTGFLAGRIAKRIGELKSLYFAFTLLFSAGLMMLVEAVYVPKSFIPVLLTMAIFCSMMCLSQAAGFSLVMECKKGGAGAASGIFGVMHFLAGFIATPLAGIMGEHSMIPLAVSMLVSAVLATVFMKISRSL